LPLLPLLPLPVDVGAVAAVAVRGSYNPR